MKTQTTRQNKFTCTCGCVPVHSDPSQCEQNRAATREMQQRQNRHAIAEAPARADAWEKMIGLK